MTPERWLEAFEVFNDIIEMGPEERKAKLALVSDSDPELHAGVLSLLDGDERVEEVLDPLVDLVSLPGFELPLGGAPFPADDPYGLIGSEVSHYRIDGLLGVGGMGVLYRATDMQLDRTVALKLLPPVWAGNPEMKLRFLREAKAVAALDHPNVCAIHEVAETGRGLPFIAMTFYEGETVKEKIERGPLSEEEALDLARQAAEGLGAAHERGIVHRDIKPANLIVTGDGVLKILDFGLAKTQDLSLTGPGLRLGTVAYMSPEQTRGDDVDARTDLWSLGIVLYEMLTGERPFRGDSDRIVVQAIRHEKPRPTAQFRKRLGPEPREIVFRLLSKEPGARDMGLDLLLGRAFRSPVNRLLDEIHRRSIWQVLAGWGLVSWVTYEMAGTLADLVGLPLWFGTGLVVVLLALLPLLLLTGFVRGRRTAAVGAGPQDWLTWRTAGLSSVLALALLAAVTGAYMAMRTAGIGPWGTLIARDQLQPRSEIVLADFAGPPEDSALARTVTEALRIDLSESPTVTLAEPGRIGEILQLMERRAPRTLDLETAREVAIRGGMPGVIGGEIRRAGAGYVLTAQLLSPERQQVLASRREVAANDDELLLAIDRLSKGLRERIGEPLASLREASPLPEVTTSSLEALQRYVESRRGWGLSWEIAILEEAIALDSTFAMAWRALGVALINQGEARSRQVEALTRAFDLRDRLPQRERYIVEATYYRNVTAEYEKAIATHEAYLAVYPDDRDWFDRAARSNMAIEYMRLRRWELAGEILRATIADYSGPPCWSGHWVLVQIELALGSFEQSDSVMEECGWASVSVDTFPEAVFSLALLAHAQGDDAAARQHWEALLGARSDARAKVSRNLPLLSAVRGRLAEAEQLTRDAGALEADPWSGSPDLYLGDALRIATRDLFTRGDAARALEGIQAALREAPLSNLDPLDRPHLPLASLYAQAGRPDLAEAMLSEFESAVEPRLRGPARAAYSRARGEIALAEGRHQEAIAHFRSSDIGQCLTCAFPGLIRSYEAVGEPDSVIALLERYLTANHIGRLSRTDHAFLGPALERLAQLYDERGEWEKAAPHYARFVDLWADAEPEFQPRVEAARARLEQIAFHQG